MPVKNKFVKTNYSYNKNFKIDTLIFATTKVDFNGTQIYINALTNNIQRGYLC